MVAGPARWDYCLNFPQWTEKNKTASTILHTGCSNKFWTNFFWRKSKFRKIRIFEIFRQIEGTSPLRSQNVNKPSRIFEVFGLKSQSRAKLECHKKFVKLKGDLHCLGRMLTNFRDFFRLFYFLSFFAKFLPKTCWDTLFELKIHLQR